MATLPKLAQQFLDLVPTYLEAGNLARRFLLAVRTGRADRLAITPDDLRQLHQAMISSLEAMRKTGEALAEALVKCGDKGTAKDVYAVCEYANDNEPKCRELWGDLRARLRLVASTRAAPSDQGKENGGAGPTPQESATEQGQEHAANGRRRAKVTAAARMIDLIKDPDTHGWTAERFRVKLGYKSRTTITNTPAWKQLEVARESARLQRAERAYKKGLDVKVDKRRRPKRKTRCNSLND
jgi:hypothetical protein